MLNPWQICQEISDAVDAQGAAWDIITDRRDAVREAIEDFLIKDVDNETFKLIFIESNK